MATAVYADQVPQKDVFWDKLQNKLEKLVPAKKASTTTAVGGVRGAKNDEAADVYWKGKDKAVEVNEEEIQKFNLAVECKLKGDNESALKHFEEFLVQYPQSHLRVESLQAVEKLKVDIASAKTSSKTESIPQSPSPEQVSKEAAAPEPSAEGRPAR
jgi:hypothetical protein